MVLARDLPYPHLKPFQGETAFQLTTGFGSFLTSQARFFIGTPGRIMARNDRAQVRLVRLKTARLNDFHGNPL